MRRADRLFRIVEYLKARRQVVKALDLAEEMEVSIRTIYRDMADLNLSGVPIVGEAGVGYMLDKDHIVRPLMFDIEELNALMLGAQMVKSWPDKSLSRAAQGAMDKISSVLPDTLRSEIAETFMFSFQSQAGEAIKIDFGSLRLAIRNQNIVHFQYENASGEQSVREINPLALAHFSPVWLLLGWCNLRDDFRHFRLDRMSALQIRNEKFKPRQGQTLQDFLQKEARLRKEKR